MANPFDGTGSHAVPRPPSQQRHPWRATARTAFQTVIALAAGAPMIYQAATNSDPAAAAGWAGVVLAVAAGLTRVMALPVVANLLRAVAPFLLPEPPRTPSDQLQPGHPDAVPDHG